MDRQNVERVLKMLEARGQVDRLPGVDHSSSHACLDRARARLVAAQVLLDARLWESVYTTAYDAYRTAADAVVLAFGCRVPATAGAHRISTDIAHAALRPASNAFAPSTAERFRDGRHESEYFDPSCPVEKTEPDAAWAVDCARGAVDAVGEALSVV